MPYNFAELTPKATGSIAGTDVVLGGDTVPRTMTVDGLAEAMARRESAVSYRRNSSFMSRRFPRNGVFVQLGDSNTDDVDGRPGWQTAVNNEWMAEGGFLYGWTGYNRGQNGTTLATVAGTVATSNSGTATSTRGDAWAVVNLDPDLIFVRLGTNDENSPGNRASIGTIATFRANLLILVEHLLQNSRAHIVLVLPQPFAHEDFLGITQWVDADEAADASAIMRTAHLEWVGRTDRVEVVDTHIGLFGLRCDDRTTDSQDPFGTATGPLIEDSLHLTNLGYRRMAELVARQIGGNKFPHRPPTYSVPPPALLQSIWATTFWMRGAATSSVISIDFDATFLLGAGGYTLNLPASRVGPMSILRDAALLHLTDPYSRYKQLLQAGGRSGATGYDDCLTLYFPVSGNSYTCDYITQSQIVAAGGGSPAYAQIDLIGVSSTVAGEPAGPVIIYTTDRMSVPLQGTHFIGDTTIVVPAGSSGVAGSAILDDPITGLAVRSISATRGLPTYDSATFDLRVTNQVDARYSDGINPDYSGGKRFATVAFPNGYVNSPTITLDPDTMYPGGIIFESTNGVRAVCTAGSVAGSATFKIRFR